MTLSAIQPAFALSIAALLIGQYILALFALMKLIKYKLPLKHLILWNFLIILGLYFGPIIALIYAQRLKKKTAATDKNDDVPPPIDYQI